MSEKINDNDINSVSRLSQQVNNDIKCEERVTTIN